MYFDTMHRCPEHQCDKLSRCFHSDGALFPTWSSSTTRENAESTSFALCCCLPIVKLPVHYFSLNGFLQAGHWWVPLALQYVFCLVKKKSNWSLNASLRPRLGVAKEERIFDGGNSLRMYCFFPSCLLWRRSRTIQPCSVFKGCSLHIQVAPDLILVKWRQISIYYWAQTVFVIFVLTKFFKDKLSTD